MKKQIIQKRFKNLPKIITALLLTTSLITACELDTNGGEETTSDTDIAELVSKPQPFPVTISGIEIENSPENVVCLSPSLTEIIYEMGFGEKLKGRGSYCDYPPVALETTDMGSSANPNIDRILSMSPDVVLTQTPIADKDLFIMEQAGIKTLILPSVKTLNGFKEIYQALGLLFYGAFTGAEAGEEAFSVISKAFDNPNVVYIGNFVYVTESFGLAAGDTLESAVLSCFGSNLAKSGENYDFDKTLLLENQPDIILLSDKYSLSDLTEDEVFSQLEAVLGEKIIYIDNTYFERPTKRITELLEKLVSDYGQLSE